MTPSEFGGKIQATAESRDVELKVCRPVVVSGIGQTDGNGVVLTVSLIPAIHKGVMEDDGSKIYEETGEIDEIPVMHYGCCGGVIAAGVSVGCKGLMIVCDYTTHNWIDGNPEPETSSYHDENYSFFFPTFNIGNIGVSGNALVNNVGDCADNPIRIIGGDTVMTVGNGFNVTRNGNDLIQMMDACCPLQDFSVFLP